MGKAVLFIIVSLILLGFLMYACLNQFSELVSIKADNQKLTQEVAQLESSKNIEIQECNSIKNENKNLHYQVKMLEEAYQLENQERINLESDINSLRTLVPDLRDQLKNDSPVQTVDNKSVAKDPQSNNILPFFAVGTGFFELVGIVTYDCLHKRYKQSKDTPTSK